MSELEPEAGPTRVCRKCSVTTSNAGDFCPACGTAYVRRSRRPSRKIMIIAAVVVLLLAGAGTAVAVKQHQDAAAATRAEAAAQAAADRQQRREANAAQAAQEEADESERTLRRALVKSLEEQITKDAKEKVADGLLDGPIKYSSCTATGGGSTDDLTALTGTFECMAVNKENADDTVSGYRYSGTAEWDTGSISWRLGG